MEGESVVMVPAVLPWLEYPLVGDGAPPRQAMRVGAFIDDDKPLELDHRLEGW